MRISDWSSDVCSSDLCGEGRRVIVVRKNGIQHRPKPHEPAARVAAGNGVGKAAVRIADRVKTVAAGTGGRAHPNLPSAQSRTDFWAWRRFSASSQTADWNPSMRSEEHTSELQSLMRI